MPNQAVPEIAERLLFRQMEITDLDRVVALEQSIFPQPWSANTVASELVDNHFSHCSIIECAANVIGFAIYWRVAGEGHLIRIAIEPAFRGKGLGQRFVAWLLEDMKKNKIENIYLEVRQSNRPAVRMYEHAGFEHVGIRRRYYEDGEDAVLMSLSLKEG